MNNLSIFTIAMAIVGVASGCSSSDPSDTVPDPVQNACWPNEVDYLQCSGTKFFSDGSCAKGSCVTDELVAKVFAEWALQARTASGLDESTFWERVEISSIDSTVAYIDIRAVFVLDWVRSREVFSISMANFSPVPTAEEIAAAVKLEVLPWKWQGLGAITNGVSMTTVRDAFSTCHCGMSVDWCHIRFRNGAPSRLIVEGYGVIDQAANQCKAARIDAATGEVVECAETVCYIVD